MHIIYSVPISTATTPTGRTLFANNNELVSGGGCTRAKMKRVSKEEKGLKIFGLD
jgi:hypothetical protein